MLKERYRERKYFLTYKEKKGGGKVKEKRERKSGEGWERRKMLHTAFPT